jgi:hypothetical protein
MERCQSTSGRDDRIPAGSPGAGGAELRFVGSLREDGTICHLDVYLQQAR